MNLLSEATRFPLVQLPTHPKRLPRKTKIWRNPEWESSEGPLTACPIIRVNNLTHKSSWWQFLPCLLSWKADLLMSLGIGLTVLPQDLLILLHIPHFSLYKHLEQWHTQHRNCIMKTQDKAEKPVNFLELWGKRNEIHERKKIGCQNCKDTGAE